MLTIQLAIKRLLDIVVSFLCLVILSPLFLFIALWIRRDSPGPAIYTQDRLGLKGKVFKIFKFRTMIMNAPDLRNADGSTYTGDDDPRVTKSGRFLRKTSLDEIPQLLNVLLGPMSLLGPRPDKADQIGYYEPGEERKLDMKPGISGYAMIHGRNLIAWKDRIALDIWYIDHYNLWLDVVIVLKTIPLVLSRSGVETTSEGAAPTLKDTFTKEP